MKRDRHDMRGVTHPATNPFDGWEEFNFDARQWEPSEHGPAYVCVELSDADLEITEEDINRALDRMVA